MPAFHSRASRSAKVGGIAPSSTQAGTRFWHSAAGCASAAMPSGQQMSASVTLAGFATVAAELMQVAA